MKTLPECSERKMNYSTFTIIDMEFEGKTTILEYDNPDCIIIRDRKILETESRIITFNNTNGSNKNLRITSFYRKKEDRIIFTSDGFHSQGSYAYVPVWMGK